MTHLQSISLLNITSTQTLEQILIECSYLPHLTHLSIQSNEISINNDDARRFSNYIWKLQKLVYCSFDIWFSYPDSVPNLSHLKVEIFSIIISGYQWEEIIRKYLSELKTFRLTMNFTPPTDEDNEDQLNRIIDSFRTKFWIEEHRWFVRCYWCSESDYSAKPISLSSSPYYFPIDNRCFLSKSTSPTNDEYLAFNQVTNLRNKYLNFTDWMVSNIRLSTVQDLELSLPFNEQFLTVVTSFDKLRLLTVYVENSEQRSLILSQLQYIIDRAPRLRMLTFGDWSTVGLSVPPTELTSASVRRLILEKVTFDDQQCMEISRSLSNKQCKTLSITVKYGRSVLHLIDNILQLQALIIECENNIDTDIHQNVNEFVEWLRKELPSTCIIHKSKSRLHGVRIWIC